MSKLKFEDPKVQILDITTPDFEQIHYHSATVVEDKVYLFGGKEGNGCVKEMRVYDVKANKIQAPNKSEVKGLDDVYPVSGHSAFYVEGKLWVFGGEQECLEGYVNEMYSFDIKKKEWKKHKVFGTWEIPSPREGHVCSYLGNDTMLMFGGANARKYFNTCYYLNMKSMTWSRLHPRGLKKAYVPSPRFYHAQQFYDGIIYVIGGWVENRAAKKVDPQRVVYRFDVKMKKWIEPLKMPEGLFPEGTASTKTTRMGDWLVIFGGFMPHFEKNDHRLSAFNLKTHKWKFGKDFVFEGETYLKMEHPTFTAVGKTCYLVGGNIMTEPKNNNIHTLTLDIDAKKKE